MQCAILQSDEISVQFRHFVHIFLSSDSVSAPNSAFCFYCFLQLLMANRGRYSHFPSIISLQNVFGSLWQEIRGVLVVETAFWIIVDNCWRYGILSFLKFDLHFLWFLIGLEGRYQRKNIREHLIRIFLEIADVAFCIVADDMFLWRTDENYPSIIIKYPPYLFLYLPAFPWWKPWPHSYMLWRQGLCPLPAHWSLRGDCHLNNINTVITMNSSWLTHDFGGHTGYCRCNNGKAY